MSHDFTSRKLCYCRCLWIATEEFKYRMTDSTKYVHKCTFNRVYNAMILSGFQCPQNIDVFQIFYIRMDLIFTLTVQTCVTPVAYQINGRFFVSNVDILSFLFTEAITSGVRAFVFNISGRNFAKSVMLLALLALNNVFLILRLCLIGGSDMNSTPPAITESH